MKKIIVGLLFIVLMIGCKKTILPKWSAEEVLSPSVSNPDKNLRVTTHSYIPVSAIGANLSGEIDNGNGNGNNLSETGFCYSTNPGPTINNDTVHGRFPYSNFPWEFVGSISGLTPGTTYYTRAYIMKNNGDVYYGNEVSFTTLTIGLPSPGVGIVYDIDGNAYNTLTYGTQVWMIENLKTTRYRDGAPIPNLTDNTAWSTTTGGAYADYNNNPANSVVYGRLYNQYAMRDSRIAPAGWHVPNYSEWVTLVNYLGGGGVAGGRMKEAGFTHWLAPNTGADNTSGFTALGAGQRTTTGTFATLQVVNALWIYSISNFNELRLLSNSNLYSFSLGSCESCTTFGYSIRLVKD